MYLLKKQRTISRQNVYTLTSQKIFQYVYRRSQIIFLNESPSVGLIETVFTNKSANESCRQEVLTVILWLCSTTEKVQDNF